MKNEGGGQRVSGTGTRERIVVEALKLVSLKGGFHSTSLSDILAATNLSKGAFYNYFKSKDEIFDAIIIEAQKVWRFQMLHNVKKQPREIDKIRQIIKNFKNRYLKDHEHFPGGCVFITLAIDLKDEFPSYSKLADAYKDTIAAYAEIFERAKEKGEIRSDVSSRHAAAMIFASTIGTSVFYTTNKSEVMLNTQIKAMMQYLDHLEVLPSKSDARESIVGVAN